MNLNEIKVNMQQSNKSLIHPGEKLAEVIDERELDFWAVVRRTKISPYIIDKILKCKEDITEELATRFEIGFLIPKSFWLNLQKNYDEEKKNENFKK